MIEHNHSHVVKSGQDLQGTEPIDGAKSGYQKQQPNIAMSQSQKLTDNSVKRNMHDPESFNPHKIDNINEVISSGFQKNGHKSKNKFRMYGSKRCLPAYTVLLRGQDFGQKSKIQNISPNMSSLRQNDYKSNPKSQGPLSISNETNHRKIFGAKKAISPSLTIIEPDSRILPKDSEKEENKENSAFRNEPSLTIVPKQSRNDKRKSSLPKARMIGTHRKIRARIDEIGFDLEPIERNENSRIQQNNQANKQNETKQDSKRNKDNESDELNVNKLEEAQKKFLYEQENNENKTRSQKMKENQVNKDGIKKQSKKQNDDSLEQTNRSLIKQAMSQEQKKQIPRHITNLTVFNKFPSVVLTPSKKVKAYIQYVEPESKESRGFRRGHFLEEQGRQTNQAPKANKNNSSQDPTFILVDKSNTKDNVQPSVLGLNCNEANGKKEQSSLQLKIQSKIEGNNSNIEAADDKKNEKDPLLKKQEQPTKQKQEQQKNKKRPTIVLNSSKSINAYFQFLEEKQPNKKASKTQNGNSTTANELIAKAQATRSESKKKMTMIGSHKSIEPYFENIEQLPARNRDQNVAGNSESDRIIEDEVQEGFDHLQQHLLENRIENNEKVGKQRKNSVKQLSSDKNVKAYVDYIEQPKNETVPKETKDIQKGSTATDQKNDFKFDPRNYEPIKWFASYNSKNNEQPFELADREVDHKKTSISMSSRKQLRSQIDLILQGELGDNQTKARNEKKNRSSKISDPNSSRRQLSSLKNINAYKQLIEEPNKSQQNKEAENDKKHQQNSNIKQHQPPNNANITQQKQEKKVQILDAKEAVEFKPESYPIMDWYTTYNRKNTSSPYQLNNRQVQKKKGISSRKDIRSQIDLILEEQVKKDDVKHISNSNSKISQNASSMKQLSSLKNVKAYVEYIDKPKQNSQVPVEIPVKQQQIKKSSPAEKKCDKKEQQLPTDNKKSIVPMKFNPQSYPQMSWYACYNKNNQSAPFEINDKLIEEKKQAGKKISEKQKVQDISKQNVSSKKPINEASNSQSKNKSKQQGKPKEVKQADDNLGAKKNQDLPAVNQYSFTPSTYPIVDWYTGYDSQQPQSCFILSDKQQNTKLNEPEQKVKNCEDDTKKGEQKPYGKYLSYSQMSDSVVRIESKLNEDELKDKNGGNLLKEDTDKLTELQNNENIAKKQSNQTDLNDLPADLSGTKGEDNFILPQKDQNEKLMPVQDQKNRDSSNQNNSQVSKQKSQSKSSKLSLSRGSDKNQETKSNGTQKLITQQIQINTKALIEDAYNKLQVQESSKQEKPKSSQLKKEQKNVEKSNKIEKADKSTTTEKKPDDKIKTKQDQKTIQKTENEEKKAHKPKQGEQMTKKENDKKQAKKQRNSKQVQNDLENIKKQQAQSQLKRQNKMKPNENKSLSKRGSQIQLIPINAEHDKIDRFQEQEQQQESKAQNNQNKSENLRNQNQFNNNSLSNRSLLSKSQEKGSLKALVRVSPKLQRSQRKSNDSIRVDQEEDYEQQVKLEKISPKKISKQSQNKARISRRSSNQKISNEGQNNQIKKVGLYKFKETIQSKQNIGSKPKRASNVKNEDMQNRIGKRSEESERYCPKTPTNQSNSASKYSSQNNRNKPNKNKKGKAVSPYLQPAFMALRSEKSPKNDRSQNEEKRQAHSNNIIEEDSQSEASRRLRKQGIARRNKKNNMAYNQRQIQKLKAEYQKIKKIEQSSQERRQKTHKIRSIQNERQVSRGLQSEQQIRSHKFLRAHSHQFSYLYPTAQNITENDKLAKKAKQLNQKLKRCSYTLGKRRQIDEVHEFISEARKQVRQSQKYLEQLE